MSRRGDRRFHGGQTANIFGSLAPRVTGLSQDGGTINGGDVISVTGVNFIAGMTSTLGTVSAITPTSCTITTNAMSAGLFGFTLSTSIGVSGAVGFTYLANPTTPSVSPSTGGNLVATAVTVTSAGLPFNVSCPFSITVNGVALTSLVATSLTTATGIIPAAPATTGAVNVVVSVDGVTATGLGAYTFFESLPAISGTVTTATGAVMFDAGGGQTATVSGVSLVVSGVTATVTQGSSSTSGIACTIAGSTVSFTMPANPVATTSGSGPTSQATVTLTNPGGTPSNAAPFFYYPNLGVGVTLIEMWHTLNQFTPQSVSNTSPWFVGVKGAFSLYSAQSSGTCTTTANFSNGVTGVTNATGLASGGSLSTRPIGGSSAGMNIGAQKMTFSTNSAHTNNTGDTVEVSYGATSSTAVRSAYIDVGHGLSGTYLFQYTSSAGVRTGLNVVSPTPNLPHREIAVFDLTVLSGNVACTFYQNATNITGVPQNTVGGGGGNFDTGGANQDVYVFYGGPGDVNSPQFFNGSLDVVSVHSGAMTQTQVNQWDAWLALF